MSQEEPSIGSAAGFVPPVPPFDIPSLVYPESSAPPMSGAQTTPVLPAGNSDGTLQLEALRTSMQNEIRTMKEALYEEIETLIFTRFQEFSSMRYEHRMEALNAAVEALKIDVV